MSNRKLVRPNLAEIKERMQDSVPPRERHRERHGKDKDTPTLPPRPRKPIPPDQTSAEAFYYVKQMNANTPMVVVLDTGEQLRGHIEWYDLTCIKVHRENEPNILVYKHCIRYVYKQEEEEGYESTHMIEEESAD